ncbi:MAG: HEAT repeat domain-containing protein [Calothrix sp. C42_A2020_038]|nr:HEAT repeat domain-containing protein [Calothrix sp. C42_A2020_038]
MDELQTALANLQHSNPNIRESALDKIGTLKPDNAFEIILPFLWDTDPEVRATAACNLGEIDDSRSVVHLIDLAENDPEEKVRSEALSALDNFRATEILMCLINEVHRVKKSRRPRQIVAQQLQHYNDERSVDALILLLEDEDVYVRIFAVDSLFLLNRSRLLNVWKTALDDESTYVIEVAHKAIQYLQNSEEFLEAS